MNILESIPKRITREEINPLAEKLYEADREAGTTDELMPSWNEVDAFTITEWQERAALSLVTLDETIQLVGDFKKLRTQCAKAEKEAGEALRLWENQCLDKLKEAGLSRAGNDEYHISKTDEIVPKVIDWEAFYDFIKSEGAFYLLQKRMAVTAFREAANMNMVIPGTEAITITKLRVGPA